MNLEERIKRRLIIEDPITEIHHGEIGCVVSPDLYVGNTAAARIAVMEMEDTANPIAQTEQVRPPLRLNIDIAAFQAVYDDLDHE